MRESSPPLEHCDRGILQPWTRTPLDLKLIHTSQLLHPRHRRQQLGHVLENLRCCAGLNGQKEGGKKGDCRWRLANKESFRLKPPAASEHSRLTRCGIRQSARVPDLTKIRTSPNDARFHFISAATVSFTPIINQWQDQRDTEA